MMSSQAETVLKKAEVFYDGRCPLCRKEINHYKRLDTQQRVVWHDIWQTKETLQALDVPFNEAMKLLHTIDRQGEVHRGAYSFIVIWRELPYYRWLARCVETLRLTRLFDVAYGMFARRRFRSRCKDGCQIPD